MAARVDDAQGASATTPHRVYVVGDSLSVGMGRAGLAADLSGAGWTLSKEQATVGVNVTSSLAKVRADVAAVRAADAVIVELGTNDCSFADAARCETSATFERDIEQMIVTIRSENAQVPISWVNIYSTKGSVYRTINEAIATESSPLKYAVIDWAGQVTAHPGKYSFDRALGVHPQGGGYRDMAAFVSAQLAVPGESPLGSLDAATPWQHAVRVTGWAIDPDTSTPDLIEVAIDGVLTGFAADEPRADVAAAVPGLSADHGFDALIPAAAGAHQVCAVAKNAAAGGTDTDLGCQIIVVGSPFGSLDRVRVRRGTIRFSGWVVDPDTSASVEVDVYLDDVGSAQEANDRRTDVAAAFPEARDRHGYHGSIAARAGRHRLCVYGINQTGDGMNSTLGCQVVRVENRRTSAARIKTTDHVLTANPQARPR